MDDPTLMALCIWSEAAGEPHEGRVAVGLVIQNRLEAKYQSDGTMVGTVLKRDQFSDFYFTFRHGSYQRVASNPEQAEMRAEKLLGIANIQEVWNDCVTSAREASTRVLGFSPSPEFTLLFNEPRALMYANLAISNPSWARTLPVVTKIGHHTFFKA